MESTAIILMCTLLYLNMLQNYVIFCVFIFFNVYLFILRESAHAQAGGKGRDRGERESQTGFALSAQPQCRAQSQEL